MVRLALVVGVVAVLSAAGCGGRDPAVASGAPGGPLPSDLGHDDAPSSSQGTWQCGVVEFLRGFGGRSPHQRELFRGHDVVSGPEGELRMAGVASGGLTFDAWEPSTDHAYVASFDVAGRLAWHVSLAPTSPSDDGGAQSRANTIAADSSGAVVVGGSFEGSVVLGDRVLESVADGAGILGGCALGCESDGFIAKVDIAGEPLWATRLGGSESDEVFGIAVNKRSQILVTGSFANRASFGRLQAASSGRRDAFIAMLDEQGGFRWVRVLGGEGDDVGRGVAVTASEEVVAVGSYERRARIGSLRLPEAAEPQSYVAKLDAAGRVRWVRVLPIDGRSIALDVAVAPDGDVVVVGAYRGSLETGRSSHGDDAFVWRLSADGRDRWQHGLGGIQDDEAIGVTVDHRGDAIWVTGQLSQGAASGQGERSWPARGSRDLFVLEMSPQGDPRCRQRLEARTPRGVSAGHGVAVAPDGSVLVGGAFGGQVQLGDRVLKSKNGLDILIAKLVPRRERRARAVAVASVFRRVR